MDDRPEIAWTGRKRPATGVRVLKLNHLVVDPAVELEVELATCRRRLYDQLEVDAYQGSLRWCTPSSTQRLAMAELVDWSAYEREIDELIVASGLDTLHAELRRLILPSIRLRSRANLGVHWQPGQPRSRLGGVPHLPTGTEWPRNGGIPLAFLAEVDLAEVAPFDTEQQLPPDGTLVFFGDAESLAVCDVGASTTWRVLFGPAGTLLERREPPAGIPDEANFGEVLLQPELEPTLVDLQYDRLLEVVGEDWRAYHNLRGALADRHGGYQQVHRMLGHAWPAQDNPLRSPDRILLLQIDSEYAAGMQWGDAGGLYFTITRADLATRRFDHVSLEAQCC